MEWWPSIRHTSDLFKSFNCFLMNYDIVISFKTAFLASTYRKEKYQQYLSCLRGINSFWNFRWRPFKFCSRGNNCGIRFHVLVAFGIVEKLLDCHSVLSFNWWFNCSIFLHRQSFIESELTNVLNIGAFLATKFFLHIGINSTYKNIFCIKYFI